MKAADLRLGNYVFLDNMIKVHEIFEVRPLNMRVKYWRNDVERQHISIVELDRLKPIELTTDWLDKFNFETDQIMYWHKNFRGFFQLGYFADGGFGLCAYGHLDRQLVNVKYVHQLQNLFYYINGKELIIDNLK